MKYILCFLLAFVTINSKAQAVAIKLKSYSWNNPSHQFDKALNANGKKLLDSVLKDAGLDTSKCTKVDYNETIKLTQSAYLKSTSYTYYDYSIEDAQFKKHQYKSYNGYDTDKKVYCILRFSTNNTTIDNITLYHIE